MTVAAAAAASASAAPASAFATTPPREISQAQYQQSNHLPSHRHSADPIFLPPPATNKPNLHRQPRTQTNWIVQIPVPPCPTSRSHKHLNHIVAPDLMVRRRLYSAVWEALSFSRLSGPEPYFRRRNRWNGLHVLQTHQHHSLTWACLCSTIDNLCPTFGSIWVHLLLFILKSWGP